MTSQSSCWDVFSRAVEQGASTYPSINQEPAKILKMWILHDFAGVHLYTFCCLRSQIGGTGDWRWLFAIPINQPVEPMHFKKCAPFQCFSCQLLTISHYYSPFLICACLLWQDIWKYIYIYTIFIFLSIQIYIVVFVSKYVV